MRRLFWILVLLLFAASPCLASTTAAERAANAAAQAELDGSPRDGNIPSYQLKPADLAKAAHLEHVHDTLHFLDTLWGVAQLVLLLSLGVVRRFRDFVVAKFKSRWLQCYGFLLLFLVANSLLDLPVAVYGQWMRKHYGLSVQHWAGWVLDKGKEFVIGWAVGGLLVMLLFFFIRKFPRRWWLVFWVAFMPISLFGVFVTPYTVDRWMNEFEPLQLHHPELVQRLEEVAQRGHMDIPPERMFLMKASKKVTTLNAYVTGFGASKRVVVWDTSIMKGTPDEILFIFGHESGHYVLRHIVRGIAMSFASAFVLLYLGYLFVQWSIRRWGAAWGVPSQADWGAMVVLLLASAVMGLVLEPVQSGFSRGMEHDADVYGQEAIHGIVADPQATARGAFQVLGETSFDDPNPSQFVEWWTYSHPSIGRRAAFAAHYDPWAAGAEPKYFPKP